MASASAKTLSSSAVVALLLVLFGTATSAASGAANGPLGSSVIIPSDAQLQFSAAFYQPFNRTALQAKLADVLQVPVVLNVTLASRLAASFFFDPSVGYNNAVQAAHALMQLPPEMRFVYFAIVDLNTTLLPGPPCNLWFSASAIEPGFQLAEFERAMTTFMAGQDLAPVAACIISFPNSTNRSTVPIAFDLCGSGVDRVTFAAWLLADLSADYIRTQFGLTNFASHAVIPVPTPTPSVTPTPGPTIPADANIDFSATFVDGFQAAVFAAQLQAFFHDDRFAPSAGGLVVSAIANGTNVARFHFSAEVFGVGTAASYAHTFLYGTSAAVLATSFGITGLTGTAAAPSRPNLLFNATVFNYTEPAFNQTVGLFLMVSHFDAVRLDVIGQDVSASGSGTITFAFGSATNASQAATAAETFAAMSPAVLRIFHISSLSWAPLPPTTTTTAAPTTTTTTAPPTTTTPAPSSPPTPTPTAPAIPASVNVLFNATFFESVHVTALKQALASAFACPLSAINVTAVQGPWASFYFEPAVIGYSVAAEDAHALLNMSASTRFVRFGMTRLEATPMAVNLEFSASVNVSSYNRDMFVARLDLWLLLNNHSDVSVVIDSEGSAASLAGFKPLRGDGPVLGADGTSTVRFHFSGPSADSVAATFSRISPATLQNDFGILKLTAEPITPQPPAVPTTTAPTTATATETTTVAPNTTTPAPAPPNSTTALPPPPPPTSNGTTTMLPPTSSTTSAAPETTTTSAAPTPVPTTEKPTPPPPTPPPTPAPPTTPPPFIPRTPIPYWDNIHFEGTFYTPQAAAKLANFVTTWGRQYFEPRYGYLPSPLWVGGASDDSVYRAFEFVGDNASTTAQIFYALSDAQLSTFFELQNLTATMIIPPLPPQYPPGQNIIFTYTFANASVTDEFRSRMEVHFDDPNLDLSITHLGPQQLQFHFTGSNALYYAQRLVTTPFAALADLFGVTQISAATVPPPKAKEGSGAKLEYLLIGLGAVILCVIGCVVFALKKKKCSCCHDDDDDDIASVLGTVDGDRQAYQRLN